MEITSGSPISEDPILALSLLAPLRRPVVGQALGALCLRAGSEGVDVGCGIGLEAVQLITAVGAEGHVTGVDISPGQVAAAQRRAEALGLADRLSFVTADIYELPFDAEVFDWAWSGDCVGYAPGQARLAVAEMARVVKPGGTVALFAWSSQQLLPGHPDLEARLAATAAGLAPWREGHDPDAHFMRAPFWLAGAGLRDIKARTFTREILAPLKPEERQALLALFAMRWPGVEAELSPREHALFASLTDPASPGFLPDRAGYYAFFTYSMFWGRVA
ncbi:MAG: methyltransferase domain-containing protein [Candidatus Geothermincolia bacterium]